MNKKIKLEIAANCANRVAGKVQTGPLTLATEGRELACIMVTMTENDLITGSTALTLEAAEAFRQNLDRSIAALKTDTPVVQLVADSGKKSPG